MWKGKSALVIACANKRGARVQTCCAGAMLARSAVARVVYMRAPPPLCAIARAHAGTIRYEPWRGHAQAPWTEPIRPRRRQLLRHSLAGDLERAWRERGPAQGKSAKA